MMIAKYHVVWRHVAEPRLVLRGRTEQLGADVSPTLLYVIFQDLTRPCDPHVKLWLGRPTMVANGHCLSRDLDLLEAGPIRTIWMDNPLSGPLHPYLV